MPDEAAAHELPAPPATSGVHEIVVVGGGAAGLELVTRLGDRLGRRGAARVTLVERARTHLWKPLLHSVAAGSMDPGEHELNYLAQAHWHHFHYRLGEMTGLDRARKEVGLGPTHDEDGREITPPRRFRYDTLVIAIGSITNDFGTPGAAQFAVPLETPEQARRFNRRLVNACLRAHTQGGPVRAGQLHVAIIGAGATGTELAAELHRTARAVVAYGLDRIDPEHDIRIVLIEAAPRILPALPERIATATLELLQKLGVEVRTGARVSAVRADGVELADGGFVPAELVVWAAGVKAPDVLHDLDGLEVNRINQLVVTPTLADDARPRHLRNRRLRGLPAAGRRQPSRRAPRPRTSRRRTCCARSRAGCAARRCSPSVSRFRLAGLARPLQHRRQPHGVPGRPQLLHRGAVRPADVPLALQDARAGALRHGQDLPRHAVARAFAPDRADGEAALTADALTRRQAAPAAPPRPARGCRGARAARPGLPAPPARSGTAG